MRTSILVAAAVALLAGLQPGAAGAAELKIATVLPENTQWMRDMRAGAAEIKERTEGRVLFKFYSGGVQGNPNTVLRKIKIGQLHGGAFTPTDLQQVYADLNIYGLPFLFESVEEANYVREAVDQKLAAGLEAAGFVSFGFASGGFARILSNVPVRSHEDLRGRKVWVPEGDLISYEAMKALDLSPVTLPITDVLTGLQTGLLDIVAMSPAGALVLQWHTRVDYVTRMPIVYSMGLLAIDRRAFGRIAEEDRAVVRDVMSALYARWDVENQRDAEKALQALINSGLEPVDPAPGEVERLQAIMAETSEAMARDGLISPDLLQEIRHLIEQYRASDSAAAR
ncbi:MAG TPA: TRAP transporter substrate-binding protein DctP [Woeseiaceae bacterium]|nr:TRAP transporter substrate-binding protein DctP [Woeseiaceae bacterium]